jgi:hypothetical protein
MRREAQGIPDTPHARRQVYAVCANNLPACGRLTAHHTRFKLALVAGAFLRRFRAPEPFFRDWPDEPRPPLSRRLSPAFDQAIVQQVYLQTPVVGPDGQPEASRWHGGRGHTRRRRTPLHQSASPVDAPH